MPIDIELMTPQEIADLLQVSLETVHAWARKGRLAGFQTPGGSWRFRKADIEALVSSVHKPEPETAA